MLSPTNARVRLEDNSVSDERLRVGPEQSSPERVRCNMPEAGYNVKTKLAATLCRPSEEQLRAQVEIGFV